MKIENRKSKGKNLENRNSKIEISAHLCLPPLLPLPRLMVGGAFPVFPYSIPTFGDGTIWECEFLGHRVLWEIFC
jgi:hypothetical protein